MRTFAEFWPHYVREHAHRGNRALHFAGTLVALGLVIAAVATGRWWLALTVPVAGYGLAWSGHFLLEGNRPATFRHPWGSLRGDFRMFALMFVGRMGREVARAGPRSDMAPGEPSSVPARGPAAHVSTDVVCRPSHSPEAARPRT
jgi:hypothetical protein